ncbi:protein NATD1-like [Chiloscyllium punctatum]|uniref:protein NATD1-like n=1 Tax=Chiloscyllium punctatum TaxID=137246 RepID=UPI003B63F9BE
MSGRSLLKHWPVMSKNISRPGTSASTSTHQTIKHDRANHLFSIKLDDSRDEAVLRYKYIGKKMVDLYSTQVPVKFRGQGIGVRLAQAAMNFVVEEDLKVRTSCWFVKKYLDDNPLPNYAGRIVK